MRLSTSVHVEPWLVMMYKVDIEAEEAEM